MSSSLNSQIRKLKREARKLETDAKRAERTDPTRVLPSAFTVGRSI